MPWKLSLRDWVQSTGVQHREVQVLDTVYMNTCGLFKNVRRWAARERGVGGRRKNGGESGGERRKAEELG